MCGGFSGNKNADESVQNIVNSVKSTVENRLNKNFNTFTAISYKSQIVAGTNYTVKVNVGGEEYIHVKIFVPLPCYGGANEVSALKEGVSLEDELAL